MTLASIAPVRTYGPHWASCPWSPSGHGPARRSLEKQSWRPTADSGRGMKRGVRRRHQQPRGISTAGPIYFYLRGERGREGGGERGRGRGGKEEGRNGRRGGRGEGGKGGGRAGGGEDGMRTTRTTSRKRALTLPALFRLPSMGLMSDKGRTKGDRREGSRSDSGSDVGDEVVLLL